MLPVLLILVLGAIDLGRVYYSYVTVSNGARTGAEYASQSTSNAGNLAGITNAVQQETTSLPSNPTVSASVGTDGSGKQYVRVTVRTTFDSIFNWPGVPNNFDMERTVQMRVR